MLARFRSLVSQVFQGNWNLNITRLMFALAASATVAVFSFTREELDAQNLPELPRQSAHDFGSESTVGKIPPKDDRHFAEPLPVDLVEERPVQPIPAPPAADSGEKPKDSSQSEAGSPLSAAEDMNLGDELRVKEADIASLIQLMSKKTGRNYIFDSQAVKGKKVTIYQPTKVTVAEANRIFESVLLLNGFTTVPIGENIYKVISAKDAKTTTIPLLRNTPEMPSDALVTQLIRLKYVAAQDVQQILSQFVSRDGMITASPGSNSAHRSFESWRDCRRRSHRSTARRSYPPTAIRRFQSRK